MLRDLRAGNTLQHPVLQCIYTLHLISTISYTLNIGYTVLSLSSVPVFINAAVLTRSDYCVRYSLSRPGRCLGIHPRAAPRYLLPGQHLGTYPQGSTSVFTPGQRLGIHPRAAPRYLPPGQHLGTYPQGSASVLTPGQHLGTYPQGSASVFTPGRRLGTYPQDGASVLNPRTAPRYLTPGRRLGT